MVERKISTEKYFFAFFLTVIVFLLGLFLGLVIEGKRISVAEQSYQELELELASTQLQFTFLNWLGEEESCPLIQEVLGANLFQLELLSQKLGEHADDSTISDEEFVRLKRLYSLEELHYWFLADKVQELCDDAIMRIIYFYSTDNNCPSCAEQAVVLGYFKKVFGQSLLVFSLDERLDEPMIQLIKKTYNVTTYPTLLVEKEKIVGEPFVGKDELMELVCGSLPNEEACREGS